MSIATSRTFALTAAAAVIASIVQVGAQTQSQHGQSPGQKPATSACTPEHAKMGHCKMAPAASVQPAVAAAPAGTETASTKAFKAINDKMHEGMSIPFTGNADADFVKGMIPHHQGAVDMARVVLQHGKDPALKKLARDIIRAQDKEMAFMRAWLAKNDKTAKR